MREFFKCIYYQILNIFLMYGNKSIENLHNTSLSQKYSKIQKTTKFF